MAKKARKKLKIYVLTGGSGRTGKSVMESALAQFDQRGVEIVVKDQVTSVAAARRVVRRAHDEQAILCNTLVEPEIRVAVAREAESLLTPMVDVLGPAIKLLADRLGVDPHNQPGLSHALNKEQFDRMDAVDFCLAHDDGHRPEDYPRADVVLVGVSRVSKSVTCLFLAYRGIRAANSPLTPGVGPPDELRRLPGEKVVALQMNAQRLIRLRESRGAKWKGAMDGYADARRVARELADFNRLVAQHGWRTIDVSYKSVEDVASEIIQLLGSDKGLAV